MYQGGTVYVVFGSPALTGDLDPTMLNGENGFRISGEARYDHLGISVSAAGDFNGDGFADIIIGSVNRDLFGAAYVIFGKASGFQAETNVSALNGINGFKLSGSGLDMAGYSVSGAGDVNGDGFDDVILGAPDNRGVFDRPGGAYVIFGRNESFPADLEVSALDGTNGFHLLGGQGDHAGKSVSAAGDVNGDGFADLVIGAPFGNPDGLVSGSAYVVFGRDEFSSTLSLSALDETQGFRLTGAGQYHFSGYAVSGVGDINGDGFDEVFVASAAEGVVVYGHAAPFAAETKLSDVPGALGFAFNYASNCANVGDINGDGFQDLAVGLLSAFATGIYSGITTVYFGKATGFPAQMDIFRADGKSAFHLLGSKARDYAGASISGGGDINGDGFPDLVVGAPIAIQGRGTGMAYVVYGGDPGRLRVSADGLSAIYTDWDGDLVTVKTSVGKLSTEMFEMRAEGLGFHLEKLDLTNGGFAHANLEIMAKRQDANQVGVKNGNRSADIGYLNATGIDLRNVVIQGDLGQIDCGDGNSLKPALKSLTVYSLGAHGTTTQDPALSPNLHSDIVGDVKKLTVLNDVTGGATFAVAGGIGPVTIGGNLEDSSITALGALLPQTKTTLSPSRASRSSAM
jgi:hypothetical protein